MRTWLAGLMSLAFATQIACADSGALYLAYKYASDAENGAGPGLKYTFDLEQVTAPIRVDLRLSYTHFGDPDLDLVPVEANIAYEFPVEAVIPYAGVGVGYYFTGANRGSASDDFGFSIFGGVEGAATDLLNWFVELNYLVLSVDVDKTFQKEEKTDSSIDLDGIGINAGFVYRF